MNTGITIVAVVEIDKNFSIKDISGFYKTSKAPAKAFTENTKLLTALALETIKSLKSLCFYPVV
jgi:hypothetical protein